MTTSGVSVWAPAMYCVLCGKLNTLYLERRGAAQHVAYTVCFCDITVGKRTDDLASSCAEVWAEKGVSWLVFCAALHVQQTQDYAPNQPNANVPLQ